jgi:hypothetical protein
VTTHQAEAPAIRVQGIEKSFKDLHVLRGVDFDVSAGASSRSSARTAQARPRSFASCRRC